MCYSAKVRAEYREYVKEFGATLSLDAYVAEYWEQMGDEWVKKLPKAFRAWFNEAQTPEEARIRAEIAAWEAQATTKTQQDLFTQAKRLADAERSLKTKVTKKAENDVRVATNKIGQFKAKLEDLQRTELKDRDSRIYPASLAPVIVSEGGRRVVKFMRYQCRPCGKPASYDRQYPGTYNARRDNLEKFWKGQFGFTHGVMLADAFYEHVKRHDMEGRPLGAGEEEEDVILEFKPNTGKRMVVACLWSHWQGRGEPDLLSFAAITDDPPPEVAAAGHDRCIIPIKPENIDAWLNPDPKNLADMYAILDDRERPYYEHRMAA
ncbi:SOS response-associated peptidase family protein [Lysobacter sp. 22409]|uniref:SOS response-associated peptidase family protein n=1 Tax=Lysobacter sp. 22409 TaxID=3453917 RepID=UPI003F84661C